LAKITKIEASQILDSRSKPTIEVKIHTSDGMMAIDSVPSGISISISEATIVSPQTAIENVNKIIAPKLLGMDPVEQENIDNLMIDLDGTENKSRLGANAILGVSLAVSKVAALNTNIPLYQYLNNLLNKLSGRETSFNVPMPMMVMIEGGKHALNNIAIQEFLCLTSLENGQKIWYRLKDVLLRKGLELRLGFEGGFSPKIKYDEDAIELIMEAIRLEGLEIGKDVKLGLDIAANQCEISKDDILELFERYPLYLLEDPIPEDKWDHWAELKVALEQTGKEHLLVGDDLFVTNEKKLEHGINNLAADAIVIKLNQTGTLTETLRVINKAKQANLVHILSHRSGETMDTYIADLAIATSAKYIKAGAPFASERMIKYNRIKEIEHEL